MALPFLLLSTLNLGAQTAAGNPVDTHTVASAGETLVLNPFQVTAEVNEGYLSKSSTAIGRVSQSLENIPQQIDIINASMIQDMGTSNFQDALRYSSSVDFSNAGRNGASPIVRGFDTAAAVLYNGFSLNSAFNNFMGTEAIEQIEVVKGAAAVQYGPSQPGGVINIVSKRPKYTQETNVGLSFFGEGGYSTSIDATGPVPLAKSKDGRDLLAYRVVYANEDRDLYQINNDYLKRQLYYGHLTFTPIKELAIDAEFEYAHKTQSFFNSQLVLASQAGLPASQVKLPYDIYPVDWTYQDTNGYHDQTDKSFQLSAVYTHDYGRFGVWSLRAAYSWQFSVLERLLDDTTTSPLPVKSADIGKVVNFSQTVTQADVAAGRLWIPTRYVRLLDTYGNATLNTQWDITGKFDTGPVKHVLLIGTDQSLGFKSSAPTAGVGQYEAQAYVGTAGAVNAIWVDKPDLRSITNIDWNDIRSASNPNGIVSVTFNYPNGQTSLKTMKVGLPWLTVPDPNNYDKDIYVFDAMSLMNDRLQISAGARYDKIAQYVAPTTFYKDQMTYRYGAVFKILPQLHVFALHNESFLPNPVAASAAFGFFLPPQQGKQDEAGVRLPLLAGKLLLEGSVYKITTTNVVQSNPFGNVGVVPPIPANNFSIVPGVTNKGFDLSAKVNLSRSTQLIASYTHTDIFNAAGPAQLAQGITQFDVNNVPAEQYAAWMKYTPQTAALRHFSVNLGYRFTGRRSGGAVGSVPALYLNSYGVWDTGLSYTRGSWEANLSIRNLTDVYAFRSAPAANRLYPEDPREFTFSIRTKF